MELITIVNGLRKKYRFNSGKGNVSIEDAFNLSMEKLSDVYSQLNKELKETQDDGLLSTTKKENVELIEKMAIVKFIFETKKAEADARAAAKDKAEKKQKLLELIEKKKDAENEGKTVAELQAMVAAL